jgi:hypothetical protein
MKQAPLREGEVIGQLRLRWYLYALIPILLLLAASAMGYIHPLFGLVTLFALFFWLFSFLFALYGKFKYRSKGTK